MADKRCDNGHFIDDSWDICPYCPQDSSEADIAVVRPRTAEARLPPPDFRACGEPVRPVTAPAAPVPPTDAALLHISDGGSVERTVAAPKLDAQRRYVVGWLVALSGAVRGESFAVRIGRNVLGRDRRADIVVTDDQASAHHADLVFRPEERRFILMDHNSTNGTFVNDAEIEPRRDLTGNDIIRIGSQRFLFMPLCNESFYWDDEGLLR